MHLFVELLLDYYTFSNIDLVHSEVNGSSFHKVMFVDEATGKGNSMMKEGCNKNTQGLLMYHQQKGNLEMCQDQSWKPLARGMLRCNHRCKCVLYYCVK